MSFWQDFLDWLRGLFAEPVPPPQPAGAPPAPVVRKVVLIVFDPTVPAAGGQHLSRALNWGDAAALADGYIADLRSVSGGYLNYQVIETIAVDGFPRKQDGFCYDPDDYLACWQAGSGFHQPDLADYPRILHDYGLVQRVNDGQADEIWLFGMPYAGFYESIMGGPGAFFCNAPPLPLSGAARRFVVMGFNVQRGVGEMLEAFGHRAESILRQVFRNTSGEENLWQRFTRYDLTHPGQAECGTVHFAPNSTRDYEWGNPNPVPARCRSWTYFPDLSGEPLMLACSEWGGGDIRLHHLWWLDRFPRITGQNGNIGYNWWQYVVDPNLVV